MMSESEEIILRIENMNFRWDRRVIIIWISSAVIHLIFICTLTFLCNFEINLWRSQARVSSSCTPNANAHLLL